MAGHAVTGLTKSPCGWEAVDGAAHAFIDEVDSLPPFLMNVVSNGDAWLFLGSNGGLTAGRRSPDEAIFPYKTADKILRQPHDAGVACLLRIDGRFWEPWRPSHPLYGRRRRLLKHELGTSVVFEEEDVVSGLRLRWRLSPTERFGLIRSCTLWNPGPRAVDVELLDGWHHVLPPGVSEQTYARYSYLAAAYMRHELLADVGMAIFTLNAAISDRPEPAESLRAAAAWSLGHRAPQRLLSDRHLDEFRLGRLRGGHPEVRGEFGAYLVHDRLRLGAGEMHEWRLGIDTGLDHRALVDLRRRLATPEAFRQAVVVGLAEEERGITSRIAAADGLQRTADQDATAHHCSNVLFNVMRGGTFTDGYRCSSEDVAAFLGVRNRRVRDRHADWIAGLGVGNALDLRAAAAERGDAQLTRLINEYLPVCFSRRHGDPSRPWNRFVIETRRPDGLPIFTYSGNWRDLFQNWEALGHSHPGYLGGMIAVFLNASTADGYNPYRITREGIDWEVPDPADPWSHIGYWGDHQIVYLLRLLQAHERFWPGVLAANLTEPRYAAAVVPYRIASFDDLLRDPRHSITFDHALHGRLQERAASIGSDGHLLLDTTGEPRLFSLAEKLLLPVLVKMSNFVPGGGVWLNTQRPEWNDANNALAGWGLSVVTTCHIRRYLTFLDVLLAAAGGGDIRLSAPLAELIEALAAALPEGGCDGPRCQAVFEALGRAGSAHRAAVYANREGWVDVSTALIRTVIGRCLTLVDETIHANRCDDGTYTSYSVLHLERGRPEVRPLGPMLEGQVAVLASGVLDGRAAADLLDALAKGPLYRADQNSYMLQPDRICMPFLSRNALPHDWRDRAPGVAALVARGDKSVVVVDGDGTARFHADIAGVGELRRRLQAAIEPAARDEAAVLAIWEDVFAHQEFTGRSGSFFAFEGLGSIYWHMVAKLLLAVQECHASSAGRARERLAAAYHRIRDGLGFRKTATEYGAFPSDAYSHTPRHAGAQQPGMTGQVKEEILTRLGELGVGIENGEVRFRPLLLPEAEVLDERCVFSYVDVAGKDRSLTIPPRSLVFTFCQVPVIYRFGCPAAEIVVQRGDASERIDGDRLPAKVAAEIFRRTGAVVAIEVLLVGGGV